jgi:predicted small lipoprotein YifL
MAKTIMSSIRLHYLPKALLQSLPVKVLLLTAILIASVSGCGIKGDLYQTPAQPVEETKSEDKQNQSQQQDKAVQSNLPASNLVEEKSEQTISEQVPVKVKSNNNVS